MDPEYSISINKSFSQKLIFLSSSADSKRSKVYKFASITDTTFNFKVIHPRSDKLEYTVDHYKDQLYILSNKDGENNPLYTANTSAYAIKDWKNIIPDNKEVILSGLVPFENHLALSEQVQLDNRIRIINRLTKEDHFIKFKKEIHCVSIGSNPKRNTNQLRICYSSPTEPSIIYDYNIDTREMKEIKKDKPYPFMWLKSLKIERFWAPAEDGNMIPMTVMYNKWSVNPKNFEIPFNTYMTFYGAYSSSSSATGYNPMALALALVLVNKGLVYVVAHVRGGSDLGVQRYEDGKIFNKKNTFTDFIACSEHLISINLAKKGRITAQGRSAGG